jgi:hypothetical protein
LVTAGGNLEVRADMRDERRSVVLQEVTVPGVGSAVVTDTDRNVIEQATMRGCRLSSGGP